MKKSCWGCKHHFVSARRMQKGIYLISECGKYNRRIPEDPREIHPGCFEVHSLKRELSMAK